MHERWLTIPGPADALKRIIDELDSGRSVILCVPSVIENGWRRRLAAVGGRADWIEVPNRELLLGPDVVLRRLAGVAPTSDMDLRDIVAGGGLRGQRVVIELAEDASETVWKAWLETTVLWARYSNARDLSDRGCLILVAKGARALSEMRGEAALAIRKWRGVAERADVLLYASLATRGRFNNEFLGSVSAAIVASLAMWDVEAIDELSTWSLEEMCEPLEHLRLLASNRGWNEVTCAKEPTWYDGLLDDIGGTARVHSYVLAARGERVGVARRVWSGQVGVLFPFVEERRQELVEVLGKSLRVPFKTKWGIIADRRDLEISHIRYQIQTHRIDLPKRWYDALDALVEMRHSLSHLEVVTPIVLTSPHVLAIAEGWE